MVSHGGSKSDPQYREPFFLESRLAVVKFLEIVSLLVYITPAYWFQLHLCYNQLISFPVQEEVNGGTVCNVDMDTKEWEHFGNVQTASRTETILLCC